ncbi:MAG TPA: AAA family ATPase [Saprospiraceae bacterium]|nr:AAA family ATPase [Saprospiraceae bacterium]MCC6688287.1 AAA family ATPase [Saprospiraceae bacterium]HMV23949.1 AAA family ATPase [Saprospiraceae bacterium]HMX84795.1 AAA family ATPase [Saprospiraceae bacterium]HMZ73315.1 AAA family ATPase [Saprospiraceae bacterium]
MDTVSYQPLILDQHMNDFLELMEYSGQSMFITGKAGTGKSTLLQLFKNTTKKNVVALAPTGIAALNIQGQTIHSFFGFPARLITNKDIRRVSNYGLIRKIDVLIIDEISMVRADLMDGIDQMLRINRGTEAPFGGVQLMLFGDLFQLPPVLATTEEKEYFRTYYNSPYFFDAKIFKHGYELKNYELQKVYRQDERHFIRLLDNIRTGTFDWDDLEEINQRVEPDANKDEMIVLAGRNATVDRINKDSLSKIKEETYTFHANVTGNFDLRRCPADISLDLKKGARVMFIKNDPLRKYVNGTLGIIDSMTFNEIKVRILDNNLNETIVTVEKETWEMHRYKLNQENQSKIDIEVIGTFSQFPVRLAWALTIHKSQGKTFDRLFLDNEQRMFEHGQLYVALSRCRTMDGLHLHKPVTPRDIMIDPTVMSYYVSNF